MSKTIGDILVELNLLDAEGLGRAKAAGARLGAPLSEIVVKLGLVSESDRARAFSRLSGAAVAEAEEYPETPPCAALVSANFLKASHIALLADRGDCVEIAMVDPTDAFAVEALAQALGKEIVVKVGLPRDIERALAGGGAAKASAGGYESILRDLGGELDDIQDADIERLRNMASEAPVIRLVNRLIADALEERASDIHVEPYETRLIIRYRIDGVLREIESPPLALAPAIVSRIKIMANLNIAERRLSQDGRISMQIQGKTIDLRISTLPSLHGESVVIRILEKGSIALDFSRLGMTPALYDRFQSTITQRHGILLVTGPTGSGKTTTLYAALRQLNQPEVKIITVEDPIEYQLEGVTQVQVDHNIGRSFAKVLRSIVRQDPDVIMVGEMRDLETAEIAVQSALTGHLVLSTLHTNDSAGAIARLLDMGLEDYLLTSTLNGVIGQRLVRTLCAECREKYTPTEEMTDRLGLRDMVDTAGEIALYRPRGCKACGGRGYAGRLGIYELLVIDAAIRHQILTRTPTSEILETAHKAGMKTMYHDGLEKALCGLTTIEEVARVTREH